MTPKNVDHLVIEVFDMNRSLDFYCHLLGLQPERLELYRSGQVPFVSVRAGSTLIDLFPAKRPRPGPPHFCLEFDDPMDAIVTSLTQANLNPSKPEQRFGARGMGMSVYVHDPDGHEVEIRTYHP